MEDSEDLALAVGSTLFIFFCCLMGGLKLWYVRQRDLDSIVYNPV